MNKFSLQLLREAAVIPITASDISKRVMQWVRVRVRVSVSSAFSEAFCRNSGCRNSGLYATASVFGNH